MAGMHMYHIIIGMQTTTHSIDCPVNSVGGRSPFLYLQVYVANNVGCQAAQADGRSAARGRGR